MVRVRTSILFTDSLFSFRHLLFLISGQFGAPTFRSGSNHLENRTLGGPIRKRMALPNYRDYPPTLIYLQPTHFVLITIFHTRATHYPHAAPPTAHRCPLTNYPSGLLPPDYGVLPI
jgi:hypothetical protein